MEHFSAPPTPEASPKDPEQPTIERLTNWVVGLQTETQRQKASNEASRLEKADQKAAEKKSELEFERRREVMDDQATSQHGTMVAIGEVLDDKLGDGHLIGAAGIQQAAKQKKLARQESQVSQRSAQNTTSGLTPKQAVQLGILCGVGVAVLIVVWLSVR